MKRQATIRRDNDFGNKRSHPALRWGLLAAGLAVLGVVLGKSNTPDANITLTESAHNEIPKETDFVTLSLDLPTPGTATTAKSSVPMAPAQPVQPATAAAEADTPTKASGAANSVDVAIIAPTTPAETTPPAPEATPQQAQLSEKSITVESGDSLAKIFKRMGVPAADLHQIMQLEAAEALKNIHPGDEIRFTLSADNQLKHLNYDLDAAHTLQVIHEEQEFSARTLEHELERRTAFRTGVIDSSLYKAAADAGLPTSIIMEAANIFGWEIDFVSDIRKGDRFAILYEELYKDGEKIKNGDILAAEFVNRGESFKATRFTLANGDTDYFNPEGKSLRKAFNRYPVDVVRISSHFNPNRMHPVLHKVRAHKGTDFAAAHGTPIKATGNGKIAFQGWKGGYGNVVFIKHGQQYTTVYGHMSRFRKGLGVGSRVKKGQIIGYVGATGYATGPHVHYEFRVNGVHRNPIKVKLPASAPVPAQQMAEFKRQSRELLAKLETMSRTQLAQAEQ